MRVGVELSSEKSVTSMKFLPALGVVRIRELGCEVVRLYLS